jgi:hypothetical protein
MPRELDRDVPAAAGRARDEHAFPRLQRAVNEEPLRGSQRTHRQRRCLDVRQVARFGRQSARQYGDVIRSDIVAIERR